MPRREAAMAERMADAVVKRLLVKKLVETKDEAAGRGAVRKVLMENLQAEERVGAGGGRRKSAEGDPPGGGAAGRRGPADPDGAHQGDPGRPGRLRPPPGAGQGEGRPGAGGHPLVGPS